MRYKDSSRHACAHLVGVVRCERAGLLQLSFDHMAGSAERLKILDVEPQVGPLADRLDVIHVDSRCDSAICQAMLTQVLVTLERQHSELSPSFIVSPAVSSTPPLVVDTLILGVGYTVTRLN